LGCGHGLSRPRRRGAPLTGSSFCSPACFERARYTIHEIASRGERQPVPDDAVERCAERSERRHVTTAEDNARLRRFDTKAQRAVEIWKPPRVGVPVEGHFVVRAPDVGGIAAALKAHGQAMPQYADADPSARTFQRGENFVRQIHRERERTVRDQLDAHSRTHMASPCARWRVVRRATFRRAGAGSDRRSSARYRGRPAARTRNLGRIRSRACETSRPVPRFRCLPREP